MNTREHHDLVGEGMYEFFKEAAVFGASQPHIVDVDHAGIPYSQRRAAYHRYLTAKSKEHKTGVGTAAAVGAGVGAAIGAFGGAGTAAFGGIVGGAVGALTGLADSEEVDHARRTLSGGNRALEASMSQRMAQRVAEREADERYHRYHNTYQMGRIADSLSRR